MSRRLFIFLLMFEPLAMGAGTPTALEALKMLPKGAAESLALMEAFEGKPEPAQWHILVHDPQEETGVREFVVAHGEVIASRTISQFAEELKSADVIGAEALKFDTDKVLQIAQKYAKSNGVTVAEYNFELKKDGEGAVPLWHLNCLNEKGESLAKLVVTATKGAVISHDGFATEPTAPTPPPKAEKTARVERKPEVRRAEPARPMPAPEATPEPKRGLLRRVFGGGREPAQ